ncbi:MAG TPA: aspartyl protease family protein [Pyrinomonadaceae bacterium]|nr:aspartyl protease family protein [Pyrinomonadaceae bacterium]
MRRMLWLLLCALCQLTFAGTSCTRIQSTAFSSAQANAVAAQQTSASDFTIAGGKTSTTLPFDLIDNRIVINVRLNGQGPFRLIFDSGAGAVISPEVARSLGLKIENLQTGAGGVGEGRVERGETTVSRIEVGDIRFPAEDFSVISFSDTKYVFGANRIDGIIGYSIFRHLVVSIDYERKQLTFTEPSGFVYKGNGAIVPIDFDYHLPLIKGELDGVPGIFVIDTGARSSLILYGPFVEQNNLREKYKASFEGVTGWGIGGPVRSHIVRVKTLRLGSVEVQNLIARLSLQKSGALTSANRAALVGPDVLKQFTTIFDYSRRRIIFEKNNQYGKPDSYDRAGMWFGQEGDRFSVIDVIAGGPAAEAGIRVGDEILAIDGQSVERLDLPTVRLSFKNDSPKKRVRLVLERDGARREVTLILRDLV